MDSNQVLNFATEGSKAITKINETIQKAFGHRWSRKQDKADAEADERRLKMIRDNPDMEIVFINGQMSARQRSPEELVQHARLRQLAEFIRQESNIENVIEAAVEELNQVDDVSNEPVDEDWIVRFFNIVRDVSSEEMQFVWGKILAGEIKSPGAFSLRTLDVIRNISRNEAQTFQKITPFIIHGGGDCFIPSNPSVYSKYGVVYEDIMLLDECGLINSDRDLRFNIPVFNNSAVVYNQNHVLLAENAAENSEVSFCVYSLTKAGRELLNILEYTSNDIYFDDFATAIFKENNYNFKIQGIASISKDGINTTGETIKDFSVGSNG